MSNENPAATPVGTHPADGMQRDPKQVSTARVIGGVSKVTLGAANGDSFEQAANVSDRYSQSDEIAATKASGDIISTIRHPFTSRSLSGNEIRPDSIISLPNMGETTVAAALSIGAIKRTAQGDYIAAGEYAQAAGAEAPKPQQQPKANEAPQPTKVPDLDPEYHQIASDFGSKVGNMVQTSAVADMLDSRGALSPETTAQIAGAMGLEPGEVRERASKLYEAFRQQAFKVAGPNAAAAFAWAETNEPEMLRNAAKEHIEQESSAGYARVVDAWTKSLPYHSPALILQSPDAKAIGARREPNGDITIVHPELGRVSWAVALRMGAIAPRLA